MNKTKIEITNNKNGTVKADIMLTVTDTSVPMLSFNFEQTDFFQYSKEEDDLVTVKKYALITENENYYLNAQLLELIAKIARYLDWENVEIDGHEIVDKRRGDTDGDQ